MTQISIVGTWLDLSILISSHPWLLAQLLFNQRPVLNPKTPLWPFPPFFEPWTLPPIKPHIQPHYSRPRIPILVTSQWWASQARLKLALLPSSFGLPLHQHILSRREVLARRSCQSIFHPCSVLLTFLLMQVQRTRPQGLPIPDPWQRCEACIWYQKPLEWCPILQFSPYNQRSEVWSWVEVELGQRLYVLGSSGEAFLYHVLLLGWPFTTADSEFQSHAVICSHNRQVVVSHCQFVSILNLQHGGQLRNKRTTPRPSEDWTW